MVSVAQLAERQIVALVVVGSSPIAHPTFVPSQSNHFVTGCIRNILALSSNG